MPGESAEGTESCPAMTKSELQELLGPPFRVESFTSRRLTQPGDNYFSNIQALEVTLLPDHKKLSLVAKLPPVSAFLREMSHFGLSLRKEMRMYLEVAKVFQEIQQESSVPNDQVAEFFPKCYGAHVSYVDDKPVADKSALLMKNLGSMGYRCADRIAGLDLAHTDLVVSRLARFHATAIAVKIKKPLVFENIILPACEKKLLKGPPPPPPGGDQRGKMEDALFRQLENIEEMQPFLDRLKKSSATKGDFSAIPKEPFASIKHGDFWTNNVLFKYSPECPQSEPLDVRFVDFQMIMYDSPARDLIFFLYSSTQLGLVPENYSHFIQLYHEQFADQLLKLGCDTEPFSRDALNAEIDRVAHKELPHCLFMLNIITKDKSDAPDVEQINSHEDLDKMLNTKISVEYEKKVVQLVEEFSKQGWL